MELHPQLGLGHLDGPGELGHHVVLVHVAVVLCVNELFCAIVAPPPTFFSFYPLSLTFPDPVFPLSCGEVEKRARGEDRQREREREREKKASFGSFPEVLFIF